MRKIFRTKIPDFLKVNYEEWGREYKEKRNEDKRFKFYWHSKYEDIIDLLALMTNDHCSFYDGFELGAQSRKTIEHFRPKSVFPLLAYDWYNLFLSCDACQSAKRENFEEGLLKPDVDGYSFSRYFIMNYDGSIDINKKASLEDQKRAEITIRLYKLNRIELKKSRKSQLKYFIKCNDLEINDMPYRFMFE
ncbi:MAG: hypothetical protein HQK93_04640 [Nitrospirae bacterium]|nr:hypothetical protein [Nitrospirota bacterium]